MIEAKDFDFHLPPEAIAQQAAQRGYSKLLVVNREKQTMSDQPFSAIVDYFQPGDCLVINDTKVMPARLFVHKVSTHAKIELLLHQEIEPGRWTALARPSRKLARGTELVIENELFYIHQKYDDGKVELKFESGDQARRIINQYGITPLPPYIKRAVVSKEQENQSDRERYQTVFAKSEGSVAAPTAGLHFSSSVIDQLKTKGVHVVPITLHIGWGTFSALPEGSLENIKLHEEYFNISQESADIINNCKKNGKNIFACGTTVSRTLEANAVTQGQVRAGSGKTGLFIKSGYQWKIVDRLITNFHLPKSSLLLLVCAFADKKLIFNAYQYALEHRYQFYSYGDAMLVF